MIQRYALVKNNIVENMVAWNGVEDLFPEYVAIELHDDLVASVGWSYTDGVFTPPPEPEKTHAELVAEADRQKTSLLSAANAAIVPLQDAVDLAMATDAETALLTEWRKYRVLLNRVDTSAAPDIEWPMKPEVQAS